MEAEGGEWLAVGFSCCRLRHGTRGVPFCAARQMWLTCGHLSAKPPGCTMAWLCVCVYAEGEEMVERWA